MDDLLLDVYRKYNDPDNKFTLVDPVVEFLQEQLSRLDEDPLKNYCAPVLKFRAWVESSVLSSLKGDDLILMDQAKILLLDSFFQARAFLDPEHKDYMEDEEDASRAHHVCVHHHFVKTYERIQNDRLRHAPPPVRTSERITSERAAPQRSEENTEVQETAIEVYRPYCGGAAGLKKWLLPHVIQPINETEDVVAINRAKILLLDKYFQVRSYLGLGHRNYLKRDGDHICVFHVFVDAYEKLQEKLLWLDPSLENNSERIMANRPKPEAPKEPPKAALYGLPLGKEVK